ncbi:hypothetical protein [uncultured Paraglaciecola sp.]|jgi:hypothetical protein|uniref:hypothetical protein n=1 Tax=uncultured Paraglaciecola sp. TaxID=1765024 RepID=UPI0030D7BA2E|tara:strand:+ start:4499 stop:4654 length:156 start_codon:yes stop_codon:yes gene_type:complete
MNRSSKGFGLAGVLATVVVLIVAAIFSTSAKSQSVPSNTVESSTDQNNELG